MKLARYYHGTTQAGYDAFKLGEGKDSMDSAWYCSHGDGLTYLWDAQPMEDVHEGDTEQAVYDAIRQAFESATIQAAIKGESTDLYVLGFDLSFDLVSPDTSCENMEYAVQVGQEHVTMSEVVSIHKVRFNGFLSPLVVSGLLGRSLFDESVLSDELLQVAQTFTSSPDALERLHEVIWDHCDSFELVWSQQTETGNAV